MQQLTLSRPLSPTRILALPDRPRVPRNAPSTLQPKPSAALKPATSPRKRLTLPLRPVQTLSPRPAVAKPVIRGRELPGGTTAFINATQAWFWTLASLRARHGLTRPTFVPPESATPTDPDQHDAAPLSADAPNATELSAAEANARPDSNAPLRQERQPVEIHHVRIPRPCDPDDILRALDQLHQRGAITLDHARVLRRWGDRGRTPNPANPKQAADAVLWSQALTRLEVLLREKSIVATM